MVPGFYHHKLGRPGSVTNIVILLLGTILLGSYVSGLLPWLVHQIHAAHIRAELAAARARWEAAGIHDYALYAWGSQPWCSRPKTVVRDDVPAGDYPCGPLTVPMVFSAVEENLRSCWHDGWPQVDFDPERGFVTRFLSECVSVSEHSWDARFTLTILQDSE